MLSRTSFDAPPVVCVDGVRKVWCWPETPVTPWLLYALFDTPTERGLVRGAEIVVETESSAQRRWERANPCWGMDGCDDVDDPPPFWGRDFDSEIDLSAGCEFRSVPDASW